MNLRALQKSLKQLINFPIHPQWFTKKSKPLLKLLEYIPPYTKVLDIGCFDKWTQKKIHHSCLYYGLDYYATAVGWYNSKPDIFADAHSLPIKDESFDYVLILDVLEHVQNPEMVLQEVKRILKPKGKAIIQVPFLYPIHDAPRDFNRLTSFGWSALAEKLGFCQYTITPQGRPSETAALLQNIAEVKLAISLIKSKSLFAILIPLIPVTIFLRNILAYTEALKQSDDEYLMPHSYLITLEL